MAPELLEFLGAWGGLTPGKTNGSEGNWLLEGHENEVPCPPLNGDREFWQQGDPLSSGHHLDQSRQATRPKVRGFFEARSRTKAQRLVTQAVAVFQEENGFSPEVRLTQAASFRQTYSSSGRHLERVLEEWKRGEAPEVGLESEKQ